MMRSLFRSFNHNVSDTAMVRQSGLDTSNALSRVNVDDDRFLSGMRILQLGFSRQDSVLLTETMTRLGAAHVAASEQVYPLGLGKPGSLRYNGVVVNLDRFGDTDTGVERLLRFRRGSPECFVIIGSSDVSMDDFGSHRRAICDCTLRLPLSTSRLIEALAAALQNQRSLAA